MAIITCPECGQNPVSDRAATCPKCGCPIAAVNAPAAPINSAAESTPQARTIREERRERVNELAGAFLTESSEFVDSSVNVFNFSDSAELFDCISEWCEELQIVAHSEPKHIAGLLRLRALKSLEIHYGLLDDESLLRISKLQTLRKLKIHVNVGRTSAAGWLFLARLSQLDLLKIPYNLLPGGLDHNEAEELKQQLRQRMPHTIVE